SITMALLENLSPGQVYLVKVSASNAMGDGPFSNVVELTVRADLSPGHDIGLSRGSTHSTDALSQLYNHRLLTKNERNATLSYLPGATVLTYEEELSPNHSTTLQDLLGHPGDTEGSSNSEGSHETGDSGRFSHDETELTNSGPNSRPPSLTDEDGGDLDCSGSAGEQSELLERNPSDLKLKESVDAGCSHQEAQRSSQSGLSV
ncbi:hypothetical protein GOODEAATRI_022286, partial [Goodea atripinnis]